MLAAEGFVQSTGFRRARVTLIKEGRLKPVL
jgi:hypothetical protein